MASHQLPQQTSRNSASKPLNPKAKEFVYSRLKTWLPQLGVPWSPALHQFPLSPIMLHRTVHTYHPHSFGFFSPNMCQTEVATPLPLPLPECTKQELMGEKMIGNTNKRPPRSYRCMSQKTNRPAINANARREHGNKWKVGNKVFRDGHSIIPFASTMEECNRSATTTVMIKNIPYHFQCKDLLTILDEHCSQQNSSSLRVSPLSMYDFVYLPMDYMKYAQDNRQSNLGYAFVNFTSAIAAFRFFQKFNGQKWAGNEGWKVCEVTKAQIQGKEALMTKFKEKVFRCGHPSFRPVEYIPARDGANHGIKEISVGKFEKGLPDTEKPRARRRRPYELKF